MSKRVKIEVYLNNDDKDEIKRRADNVDISLSDYMKLKALDLLDDSKRGTDG